MFSRSQERTNAQPIFRVIPYESAEHWFFDMASLVSRLKFASHLKDVLGKHVFLTQIHLHKRCLVPPDFIACRLLFAVVDRCLKQDMHFSLWPCVDAVVGAKVKYSRKHFFWERERERKREEGETDKKRKDNGRDRIFLFGFAFFHNRGLGHEVVVVSFRVTRKFQFVHG